MFKILSLPLSAWGGQPAQRVAFNAIAMMKTHAPTDVYRRQSVVYGSRALVGAGEDIARDRADLLLFRGHR